MNLPVNFLTLPELSPLSPTGVRLIPLGGLGEIGMNCFIIETVEDIIVIDCGLFFTDLENFGVEFAIPDLTYLLANRDKVKGIIATHGHEDHIGAIPLLVKSGIRAPVYTSPFTARLLTAKLEEAGVSDRVELRRFEMGESFQVGSLPVRTIPVNHSIVESSALIIDTPAGRIVHTGDFKVDSSPYYGKALDMSVFEELGDEGVLLLMSDSTNVERQTPSEPDTKVYHALEKVFAASEGMVVVSMFASNVGRMGQVFELAAKVGRKVAVAGRTMDNNSRYGQDEGYLEHAAKTLISLDDLHEYDRNKVILLATGSQGEYRAALARMANGEFKRARLEEGDTVVMSSKFIPGNEKAISRLINNLFRRGANVLYDAIHDVHVSGHATRPELARMIQAVRPKFFLPVHGEYRHLVHHGNLAKENGIDDSGVLVAGNGEVLRLSPDKFLRENRLELKFIMMEGRGGIEHPKELLKKRRQMAEKGVSFVMVTVDPEFSRVVAGPEIILHGVAADQMEAHLIDQLRKEISEKIREFFKVTEPHEFEREALAEELRIHARRFLLKNTGNKSTVIPLVLDL